MNCAKFSVRTKILHLVLYLHLHINCIVMDFSLIHRKMMTTTKVAHGRVSDLTCAATFPSIFFPCMVS